MVWRTSAGFKKKGIQHFRVGWVKSHAGKIQRWSSHNWKWSLPHNSSHFLCDIDTSQLRSLNLTTASSHGITLTQTSCSFYSSAHFCFLCFPISCCVSSWLAIPSSAVSPAPFSHIPRTMSYSAQHPPPPSKMAVSPVIWENSEMQHPQTHMPTGTDIFPMCLVLLLVFNEESWVADCCCFSDSCPHQTQVFFLLFLLGLRDADHT